MQITPSRLAQLVFSGYCHSGKVDRDSGSKGNIRPKPSKLRTLRVGKKRMRKVLDKLEELS